MMTHKFTLPVFCRAEDQQTKFQVAEIEGEVDIHESPDGDWGYGAIRLYDIAGRMVEVSGGDRTFGRNAWNHVRTPEARSVIGTEWRAHVTMHGEESLLDAAERQFRHNYEAA
jgi:hypothetical protein